jgi:FMN phosphatase YigB (HAD superfamily)
MTYIADNEKKDFIAPNELGFVTIKVIRKNSIHTATSENPLAKPAHQVDSLDRIPALLSQLSH